MAICTVLEQKADSRSGGRDCSYNGFLRDWPLLEELQDSVLKAAFTVIMNAEPETRICTDMRGRISRDTVSNQIICYKDVFKLSGRPLKYPYILYLAKDGQEKAMLVLPWSEDGYLYAKGMYYCLTEPAADFSTVKNDLIALCENDADRISRAFSDLFTMKAGPLQRRLDSDRFADYEALKEDVYRAAERTAERIPAPAMNDRARSERITDCVVCWFLLKKVLYVLYMMNKEILAREHEGNIRQQRYAAKQNADSVRFVSLRDMWEIPQEKHE
ncbi:MAG: hypothetical protein K6G61_08465 [Solobacterium sp.]|nr:hypothetical protein [Solobacterium sp.]